MRRLLAFILALLQLQVAIAADIHPLLNDREGKSYYLKKRDLKDVERAVARTLDAKAVEQAFRETITSQPQNDLCSFKLLPAFEEKIKDLPKVNEDTLLALKILRQSGVIDDLIYHNLRDSQEARADMPQGEAVAPSETRHADAMLEAVRQYALRRTKKKCAHESVRQLLGDIRQKDKNFKTKKVKKLVKQAVEEGVVPAEVADEVVALVKGGFADSPLALSDIVTKRQVLRSQYPLSRLDERSNFVGQKANNKMKMPLREKLYRQYSFVQIVLMGNVIKRLRERMDSPRIEILVYGTPDEVQEVITLDPMERFRFAIRVLRKEMRDLSTNSYFSGFAPPYIDLMAAAYEIGIITAQELDEVAKLEEIWNPKKTFWDKAGIWVRMFGNILSVVLPAPFGFIPSLAVVAIEAFTQKPQTDDTHSLF